MLPPDAPSAAPLVVDLARAELTRDQLRGWVLRELELSGFDLSGGKINAEQKPAKDAVRDRHQRQRASVLRDNVGFIADWEERVLQWFAEGEEIDARAIRPEVIPVTTDEHAAVFRYVSLGWSVPVSQGYGRRTRFLVIDRHNDRLIGIFALADPVFNLKVRDDEIRWNQAQRRERLYNVLDGVVIGSVAPYRHLIGGKLVAMAAASNETQEVIRRKYEGVKTGIQERTDKEPRPVLITTTSALGRSSIYNRLRYKDRLLYRPVGYTEGYGHFHISNDLFRGLADHLERLGRLPGHRYGDGPNWRFRVLRMAFEDLGLDPELLKHGVKRQVFLAPLASNYDRYLRAETDRPRWYAQPLDDMAAFFARRWAIPRSRRDMSWEGCSREQMRLSDEVE